MIYTENNEVELTAIVKRWKHQKMLYKFIVNSAPRHVVAFVTGEEFSNQSIIKELLCYGYSIAIKSEYEEVSLAEAADFTSMING